MTSGNEKYGSLLSMYRMAEYRRFRAKHRSNRAAEIIGVGPDGRRMLGWWEGTNAVIEFDPDEFQWTGLVVYV